jgi:hypothetical protein
MVFLIWSLLLTEEIALSLNGLLRDLAVFYKVDFNQEIYMEKLEDFQI